MHIRKKTQHKNSNYKYAEHRKRQLERLIWERKWNAMSYEEKVDYYATRNGGGGGNGFYI